MAETFIVHKEWLDNIAGLPVDQQDKVIAEFVRYGCGVDCAHSNDAVVCALVNMLKNRIDFSKDKYKEKVNMSKTAGRKKKTDDKQIYDLAHQGKTAKEVAEILGIGKSTVEHSDGWTQRNQDESVCQ